MAYLVGANHEAVWVLFNEVYPVVHGVAVSESGVESVLDVMIIYYPGYVHPQVAVFFKELVCYFGKLFYFCLAGNAYMGPDDFAVSVVGQGFLELIQINCFFRVLGCDVVMDKDWQSFLGAQVIDCLEGLAVAMRRLAIGEGGEGIVAAHDFADAAPEVWIVL